MRRRYTSGHDGSRIAIDWIDANDLPHRVSSRSLTLILDALDLVERAPTELVTGLIGQPIRVPELANDCTALLELEDGTRRSVRIGPEVGLPPLPAGYHTLHYDKRSLRLAMAPTRCLTLEDIAPGVRLWGLVAQVYSLSRPGDDGIGDTTAVANLAAAAADRGADAQSTSWRSCDSTRATWR